MPMIDGPPLRARSVRALPALLVPLLLCLAAGWAWAAFGAHDPVFFKKSSTALAAEAQIHLARKRWTMAAETMERALHAQPTHMGIALQLAELYRRMGRNGDAIRLLEEFLPRASRKSNIPLLLALNHDRQDHFREALGYYRDALKLDPGRLSIYVRAAQVRMRQGLVYDAAKILRAALRIDKEYVPALQELTVVNKLIRSDTKNIYRRGNLVVIFQEHEQFAFVEDLYSTFESHRRLLEKHLAYHIPTIWIRVVDRIDAEGAPPVFYSHGEDTLLLSREALEGRDTLPLIHELTWMYVTRHTGDSAPRWLLEGLSLWFSRPPFLEETPLRSTNNTWPEKVRARRARREYLNFDQTTPEVRRQLVRSFALVRFLLDTYGWPGMRQILAEYRAGETRFETISRRVLRQPFRTLLARWNMYVITNFYFDPTTRMRTHRFGRS